MITNMKKRLRNTLKPILMYKKKQLTETV